MRHDNPPTLQETPSERLPHRIGHAMMRGGRCCSLEQITCGNNYRPLVNSQPLLQC